MKKFFLIVAMMLTMGVYSFAEDSNASKVANVEKYEWKINHRKLGNALNLSIDQMEMSDDIIDEFENDMTFASTMGSEESSNMIVANAVKKNVQYMASILTKEQYRKYLMLLNLTLKNRGFEIDIFSR